jgi:UDP-4-amino-4,6-dideoxy-N-acetyl-beta-L-altrosamine transaminase
MTIPYGRQTIDEADIAAVDEVLRGGWLTTGPAVVAFEESVAAACEVEHAVAFSSGTAALHGACFAAGLGPGDELLTSAMTFAGSANCGAYLGADIRFADIDPATLNVSPESVADRLSDRTRVVIPVHFAGLPAPVAGIREVVGGDVRIVEDAAHALGAFDEDGPVGACRHSDMAVFSFHPVKVVTSAEGGMVVTNDAELADCMRLFRTHGIARGTETGDAGHGPWYQEQRELGFNYRLSDVHSALGRSQMGKLEQFVTRRHEIADRYRAELASVPQLELAPAAPPGSRHGYHLFVIRHRDGAEARARLYAGLHERGILVQVHYLPVPMNPWYRNRADAHPDPCPHAEEYYWQCLSLPCYPALTAAEQDQVIEAVKELV